MNCRASHIALIGPLPPPAGGMGDQLLRLSDLMRRDGVDVTVVQTNPAHRPRWIASIKGVRAAARLLPYLATLWRTAGSVDVFHVMANSYWSWHLFAAPAIWIAKIRAVPCVVSYHGGEAEAFLKRSSRSVAATLRASQVLTVPSGFLQGVFARYGIESRVVPNVVDLVLFKPTETLTSNRRLPPHLVVVRNLEPMYDIPTALRAFAAVRERMPGATLSIAGTGSEEMTLRRVASELGIEPAVSFTGRISREQMASLLSRADLMLNPTTVDNMPISILEAMASCVPVVSTDVGGIPYLLEHGRTGWLVAPGDHCAMADGAVRLLQDGPLATRITEAARNDVEQYSWARVRAALEAVYDEALSSGRVSRGVA